MWTFGRITIFSISAALINALGIYVIYKNKKWTEQAKTFLMCLAAWVLLASPLMFGLPQAIAKNEYAGFAAVAWFLFMLLSNSIIQKKTKQKSLAFGITAMEGIGIHSFVDGVIYSVTFSVSILIWVLSWIWLVLHEFAEWVIVYSVLLKSGISRKKAVLYAILIASLTTPLGAFIAYPLIHMLSPSAIGLALGFVVGVLIYISAAHLLPEAREYEKKHSIRGFLLWIAISLLFVLTKLL